MFCFACVLPCSCPVAVLCFVMSLPSVLSCRCLLFRLRLTLFMPCCSPLFCHVVALCFVMSLPSVSLASYPVHTLYLLQSSVFARTVPASMTGYNAAQTPTQPEIMRHIMARDWHQSNDATNRNRVANIQRLQTQILSEIMQHTCSSNTWEHSS